MLLGSSIVLRRITANGKEVLSSFFSTVVVLCSRGRWPDRDMISKRPVRGGQPSLVYHCSSSDELSPGAP
jgi:hypothetical protein